MLLNLLVAFILLPLAIGLHVSTSGQTCCPDDYNCYANTFKGYAVCREECHSADCFTASKVQSSFVIVTIAMIIVSGAISFLVLAFIFKYGKEADFKRMWSVPTFFILVSVMVSLVVTSAGTLHVSRKSADSNVTSFFLYVGLIGIGGAVVVGYINCLLLSNIWQWTPDDEDTRSSRAKQAIKKRIQGNQVYSSIPMKGGQVQV
jgi:hypothetical protein